MTFAKRGDLHARRRVLGVIGDKSVVHELFTIIAPQVADREGGYTRITKIGYRKGDNAPMAVIELVLEPVVKKQRAATPAAAAASDETPAEEPTTEETPAEVVTEAEAAVDEAAGSEASETEASETTEEPVEAK